MPLALHRIHAHMALFDIVLFLWVLLLLSSTGTSYLYYKEPVLEDSKCPGKPNPLDPWVGEPKLVKTVENGSLYTAGSGDDELYGE